MKIEINGELKTIIDSVSLKILIDETVKDQKGLAVAINNSVIPKNNWNITTLNEADKVLLIRATQGG